MTTLKKYTRFFMQRDRVHTALSGDAAVVCMRGQAGVLAETRLEQETARSALLAADSGGSVVAVESQAQPEAVTYNAYGYHNPNDIPLHRPAFNGHLLLWYLYLLGNGYRAYNPVLMCFQSPDSQSPFGVGGFNCYAYCAGDPVNFSDPSGHGRTRSSSPPRSMSSATQERIVLDVLNSQPGWNSAGVKRRRLSSATEERIVYEVLNTQPGWNGPGADVQISSQHNLGLSSGQPLPSEGPAVNSVASSSGVTEVKFSGDSWVTRRTPLSPSRVEILRKYNEGNVKPIRGLNMDATKNMFDIAISALAKGDNMRASLVMAKSDIVEKQVDSIRSRLKSKLKRV